MTELIWEALEIAWDWLKKTWVKIVNFSKNIVSWFKDTARLKKLKKDQNKMAIAIKKKLDSGDYQTVVCLFDKKKAEIIDGEVITSEDIDKDTKKQFGSKDMMVLN
jgi:hypothetical protein